MRIVKTALLGAVIAAFAGSAALACMGHPKGHAQTDKPQTEQTTITNDKK